MHVDCVEEHVRACSGGQDLQVSAPQRRLRRVAVEGNRLSVLTEGDSSYSPVFFWVPLAYPLLEQLPNSAAEAILNYSCLKECEPEGHCLWAANNGRVLINTPKLKARHSGLQSSRVKWTILCAEVVKFSVEGLEGIDKKKLENKALMVSFPETFLWACCVVGRMKQN